MKKSFIYKVMAAVFGIAIVVLCLLDMEADLPRSDCQGECLAADKRIYDALAECWYTDTILVDL